VTRGNPSTRMKAYVATEVTTQLRGQFAPVVTQALASMQLELEAVAAEVVAGFRAGLRK
jgi:hypothetical protein